MISEILALFFVASASIEDFYNKEVVNYNFLIGIPLVLVSAMIEYWTVVPLVVMFLFGGAGLLSKLFTDSTFGNADILTLALIGAGIGPNRSLIFFLTMMIVSPVYVYSYYKIKGNPIPLIPTFGLSLALTFLIWIFFI